MRWTCQCRMAWRAAAKPVCLREMGSGDGFHPFVSWRWHPTPAVRKSASHYGAPFKLMSSTSPSPVVVHTCRRDTVTTRRCDERRQNGL